MDTEQRRLVVKEWADSYFDTDTIVIHQDTYPNSLRNVDGIFDHVNEVVGYGVVCQPYKYDGIIIPKEFKHIELSEPWNEFTVSLFISYDDIYSLYGNKVYRLGFSGYTELEMLEHKLLTESIKYYGLPYAKDSAISLMESFNSIMAQLNIRDKL